MAITMLFQECSNLTYKFPPPQYLGAKHTHLAWLSKFIPANVHTALDAFAGSQSVAFLFKQLGFRVITNDFLNFNHQIGLSLIENNNEVLTSDEVNLLLQPAKNKNEFTLFEKIFTDIFFEKNETSFLDNFRANISQLNSKYKQALAFTLMNRSLTRKVTMGHFCHTQALVYAKNPERIKRNRNLVRPIKEIFLDLLPQYNRAIFDNKQRNISYHQNILELLPQLQSIDLAYFDPPYCDSHADYQSFYHLLETFTEYWTDKQFINGTKRYAPQHFSGFDRKREVLASFERLFADAQAIPHWLISYNDRSYPQIEILQKIITRYRDVEIERKAYNFGRGGKGSVAGSHEILFIAKPKKIYAINSSDLIEVAV